MNWFPFGTMTQFSAVIIYIVLIIIVMSRNPRGTSNRFASALFLSFAFWSFCEMFLYNSATPYEWAIFFGNLEVPALYSFPILVFWLFVSLTGRSRLSGSIFMITLSFALPVGFMLLHWTGNIMEPPALNGPVWRNGWIEKSIFPVLFYIYYIGSVIAAITYYALNIRRTDSESKKKQAVILFISTFIALAAGTYIEVISPLFHINNGVLNYFNNIYLLFWAFGIFIVFYKYRFLALTATTAAESIISAMNEALVILDDEINISYVNRHLLGLLGYRESELKGHPLQSIIFDKSIISAFLKEVIQNRRFKNQDFRLLHKNGNPISCFFSASLIMESGEMRGIVCVATDITEQKLVQKDLKDSYDRLKELDTLKSNFTSMVSHELRTPITSIKGFLAFLMAGVGGPITEKQRDFLTTIKSNSDRLLTLINDLLDTAKMESGSFSIIKAPCNLINIITAAIKDVHSLSEKKRIQVMNSSSGPICLINADEYRVSQALINLINNAIKFSPPDSTINISAELKDFPEIRIPDYAAAPEVQSGRFAVIKVTDNGQGLNMDNLIRIFDRFYQVEHIDIRSAQGTGLGLNIVKNIAKLHGGSVWAESEGLGHGSAFIIILPRN